MEPRLDVELSLTLGFSDVRDRDLVPGLIQSIRDRLHRDIVDVLVEQEADVRSDQVEIGICLNGSEVRLAQMSA